MKTFPRRFALTCLSASALFCGLSPAQAQEAYPAKPIKVVVPYTPGGVSDTVTRLLMQKLSEQLKNPIVVENQPGANSMIGSSAVARSPGDGYTLLAVVAAHSINPSLYPKMSYSPQKDLTGVSLFGRIPLMVVSSAQLPPANVKDYVAWAKANPDKATYASSGTGSGVHLVSELFAEQAHIRLTHVPYKGIAPALPDLFSGQVSMIMDTVQTMMPYVKAGKVRALAMTSAHRWPSAPDVPTMAEQGFPELVTGSWIGLLAPSKTPRNIVDKLSAGMQKVLQMPEVHTKLIEYGIDPVGGTPQEFDRFIQNETVRWASVIKKADIKLD